MFAVVGKKNQAETLENQQNFDCFGTRTSSTDVFDEKTGPITTRTIKIPDHIFFNTLVRFSEQSHISISRFHLLIFIKIQGYDSSS